MIRLNEGMRAVLQEAAAQRRCPTVTEWARKVILEEAQRVIDGSAYDDRAF